MLAFASMTEKEVPSLVTPSLSSLGERSSVSSLGEGRSPETRGSINNKIITLDSRVFADATHKNDRKEKASPSKSHRDEPQESIWQCIRFITAVCMTLMISTVTLAEDTTTTETCADGAGTVITGAISGRKYCKSNNIMNWWNAHAWCDALGRRLFSMNDCAFSVTSTTTCNDLKEVGGVWIWTATPNGFSYAYNVNLSSGNVGTNYRNNGGYYIYALCY